MKMKALAKSSEKTPEVIKSLEDSKKVMLAAESANSIVNTYITKSSKELNSASEAAKEAIKAEEKKREEVARWTRFPPGLEIANPQKISLDRATYIRLNSLHLDPGMSNKDLVKEKKKEEIRGDFAIYIKDRLHKDKRRL